ncbi:hypothetical protein NGA_0670320 [Nannochloropsis gaditana CCMP526]|uniref:uncharacterized protein n=1 Tax=Nannochloropsis gaditana (strain CCMP526) TaxID=1093141 RepID=UPI00029F5E63|nr:hypothetical protein NGA_0670320 [Nannochloropsis gaditana CCMP526]EKU22755.1 hypothetical protein NGA_0670320 [Nannochloropsis gaditana CCMP526]|eukprot:XP_005853607.1 hypothetical protein NGA_0670320 [Nannochloropsis gaditana CCMP526]
MGSISLGEVRIAGSLLATLIQVVGQRAGRRAEGLLLGDALVHTVAVTDDTQEARDRTDLQLDVTGYVSTNQKDAFYEPLTGTMNATKIAEATSEVNRRHRMVGWYVARNTASTKPSLRDLAILRHLGDYLRSTSREDDAEALRGESRTPSEAKKSSSGTTLDRRGKDPALAFPAVLIVFSLDLRSSSEAQGISYACHYLSPAAPFSSSESASLAYQTHLLKVRNVSHDSTAEYQAYTGGTYPSLLSPHSSLPSRTSQPSARMPSPVIPSMRPGLADFARAIPPPHVTEYELYLDQILEHLHGLVDEIRAEELELRAFISTSF